MEDPLQPPAPLTNGRRKSAGGPSAPRREWRPWEEGGRIWYDAKGRPHFHIRKRVGGKDYDIALPFGLTALGAGGHLKRFLDDPEGYDPRGEVRPDPVYLTDNLMERFLTWSENHAGRDERGVSKAWKRNQKYHLIFWMKALHGLDLRGGGPRSVDLGTHVKPPLMKADGSRGPSYRQRIVVLKMLYGWLRTEEHLLKPAEDPTLAMLKAPQSKSAQGEGSHKVVPIKNILACAAAMKKLKPKGRWSDMLLYLAGTGWHVSELDRFMGGGNLEPVPDDSSSNPRLAGVIVAVAKAKRGNLVKTRLSGAVHKIAKRLVGTGGFSHSEFLRMIDAGCVEAGVDKFNPSWMRHTVATYAENHGDSQEAIASFLNHSVNVQIVAQFYSRGVALRVHTPL